MSGYKESAERGRFAGNRVAQAESLVARLEANAPGRVAVWASEQEVWERRRDRASGVVVNLAPVNGPQVTEERLRQDMAAAPKGESLMRRGPGVPDHLVATTPVRPLH
jgi:hypothetical protein